jgi:predicted metallopeptidase
MEYELAPDIQEKANDIVIKLNMNHISPGDFVCMRSYGSSSRGTIARCHGMAKVMQLALKIKPIYVLEFLNKRFDKMDEKDKTKVIIHELMHIPKNMGGGFRHHDYVTDREVTVLYARYIGALPSTSLDNY